MTATHRLRSADFATLAAGRGGGEILAGLRSAQLSKRILMAHLLVEKASARAPEIFAEGRLGQSMAALAAARRAGPAAVDALLLHPPVGAWEAHCLRLLRHAPDALPGPLRDDLAHLGALAAVAGLRAGVPFEVRTRVRDGGVMFPGMGFLQVPGPPAWANVRPVEGRLLVTTARGSVATPADPDRDEGGWASLRRLRANAGGQRLELVLDDLDPFRNYQGLSPCERLDTAAVNRWRTVLDEAWDLLVRRAPDQAEAIAAGLACLVPVEAGPAGIAGSATSDDAVGAAALTLPANGRSFAAVLVHELQHSKLAGILDLLDLYEPGRRQLFYAPWRHDPRPVAGLLHGAYAHLAVSEFWSSVRWDACGADRSLAHFEFARWREAVERTTASLAASEALTALGRQFVAGMADQASRLMKAAVPLVPLRHARQATADHRATWRLHNLEVDPDQVADWAAAWLDGAGSPPPGEPITAVRPARRGPPPQPRLELLNLRLRSPQRFRRLAEQPARLAASVREATTADVQFVLGDSRAAGDAYRREIARHPERIDLWAGLALTRWLTSSPAAARPEAVWALHSKLRELTMKPADPDALARWLAPALQLPATAAAMR